MYFTKALALTAVFGYTLAAPVANAEAKPLEQRGLLNDLKPDVAAALAAIGLASIGTPVGNIVATVGNNVKERSLDERGLEERALFDSLSALLSGVLGNVGTTVTDATGGVTDVVTDTVGGVTDAVGGLVDSLGSLFG